MPPKTTPTSFSNATPEVGKFSFSEPVTPAAGTAMKAPAEGEARRQGRGERGTAVRIYNRGQRALAWPRMSRSVGPKHDGPGGRSAHMGENTGRGLARSVGRFRSRDLPGSFGFPILRNPVPMGFGRSKLDQQMQNFKGFDFVYSKLFSSTIRGTKIELGAC